MSRFKIKRQRPLAQGAFRLDPTFKTRTQESKFKRIARGLPTQAMLDEFLSKLEPEGRTMALELIRPYLSFGPMQDMAAQPEANAPELWNAIEEFCAATENSPISQLRLNAARNRLIVAHRACPSPLPRDSVSVDTSKPGAR